jgi:hypothetical protein
LFAALALEHADRAPVLGIEHSPQGGLLGTMAARSDRIGVEARKYFVLEIVIHGWPRAALSDGCLDDLILNALVLHD